MEQNKESGYNKYINIISKVFNFKSKSNEETK